MLGDAIDLADDVPDLGRRLGSSCRERSPRLVRRGPVSAREVAALVSHETLCPHGPRRLSRRTTDVARWPRSASLFLCAVAVLGSAGRGESLLALDQDNALVYADDSERAHNWFAEFGRHLADLLDESACPTAPAV